MQCFAGRNERPLACGIFNGPRLAAIAAAREQVLLRALAIDGMPLRAEVFVVPRAEAHQDFAAPRPDAVVGRPAAEAAWLPVNFHVLDDRVDGRALLLFV